MIPMKRERMLTIRVTDDEHARLLERCEGNRVQVVAALMAIGDELRRLRLAVREQGTRDDS